jgi:hypothetical protein
MDQDFYIEETKPIKVIITVLIFLALVAGSIYYYIDYRRENVVKLKDITLELGEPLSTNINDYISCYNPEEYELDLSSIKVDENGNVSSTGEYSYKIKKNGQTKKGKVYVKDTTAPVVEVEEITVGVNELFSPNEFISKCEDLSLPCQATYKNVKDEEANASAGTYNFDIVVSDNEGNSVVKSVSLVVSGTNTLASKKETDLEFDHLSTDDNNWDKTYTLKLDKALADESASFNETIENISTKEYAFDKEVKEKVILVAYNKYDYAIGFSIRITFSDDDVIYLTSENSSEIVSDTE